MDARTLKRFLDHLLATFHTEEYVRTSALHMVRRFTVPEDQEIAGFVVAALAFGSVAQIHGSCGRLFAILGRSPARFVARLDPIRDRRRLTGFRHRWVTGDNVFLLLWFARQAVREAGSLGGFFARGYRASDDTIEHGLVAFVDGLLAADCSPVYRAGILPLDAGVRRFLPSPRDGSACKRLNLFLRWMVRRDRVDLGLWKDVAPAQLVMPVDTHIARDAPALGLTRYRSAGWRMAMDITQTLRRFDPEDPIKYDFALCRYGILRARGRGVAVRDGRRAASW